MTANLVKFRVALIGMSILISTSCSISYREDSLTAFFDKGYTYKDGWIHKSNGDTVFLASVSNSTVQSKSIFFPRLLRTEQILNSFLEKKRFIIIPNDSLSGEFVYSNKTGNLYQIHLLKNQVELHQLNSDLLKSDFE